MAKRRKHSAKLELLQPLVLANASDAVRLVVRWRGRKLGEVALGRGSLMWWGHKAKRPRRIRWKDFAKLMKSV